MGETAAGKGKGPSKGKTGGAQFNMTSMQELMHLFPNMHIKNHQVTKKGELLVEQYRYPPPAVLEETWHNMVMLSDKIPDLEQVFVKAGPDGGQGSTTDPDNNKKDTEETNNKPRPF